MKKKYPHIMVEICSHSWAITGAAFDAILRAVENGLGSDDEPIFHGAREEIRAETGKPGSPEFTHGSKVGNVGVIRIEGPITPRASWLTEASDITSSEMIGSDLAKMEADPTIEKIVMVFDTPGGVVTGTSDLAAQIKATNKPVISYIYGVAASAGYWLASAADEIVSVDTGIVGSIGTILTVWKDKSEDTVNIVSSQSPLKHVDPESKKGRAHYQAIVNDLAQVFVDAVAENRGTTAENVVKNFGRGGEHAASEALKRGMIDRISTFSDFMADLQAAAVETVPGVTAKTKLVDNNSEIGGNDFNEAPRANTENDERDRSMPDEKKTLKEFLAENPSAFSAYQTAIAEACTKAQGELRTEMATAAKVCASEDYPKSVRTIAVDVIEGKRTMAALDAVMATAEMLKEQNSSQGAAGMSTELPETQAGAQPTVSAEGKISNLADLTAALPKKVAR